MSSFAVSHSAEVSENPEPAVANEQQSPVADASNDGKSTSKSGKSEKHLPAVYQEKNISVIGASELLSHKYPVEYSPANYSKALTELKYVLIGIGSFIFLVYMGWAAVSEINFTEDGEFVYNAGLVGGLLMLVALIYAVFKRARSLHRFLKSNALYYLHMACGAVGAYLIILHTSFDLRSINGSIALITTVLVIVSGALGRYLYTLSTIALHRQHVETKSAEEELFELIEKYEYDVSLRIRKRLSKFALHCFTKPGSKLQYLVRLPSIILYGLYITVASRRDMKKIAKRMVAITQLDRKNANVLKRYQKRKLRQYIFDVVKMGYVNLLEQVLHHWRILHIPALYLLTLTAVVHVVVIHMY